MTTSRILNPKSIAIFGGSNAEQAVIQCQKLGFKGDIWPVHPKKELVAGLKAYRGTKELPGVPDAAYLAVNRELTVQIVSELAEMGAGGAICFATGFSESGPEGKELEEELLKASGDMPLFGPNCYGFLNLITGSALWPDQHGARLVEKGVAIISMSSNVAFNLSMQQRGLPIAYVLSLGNKLKFDLHDAIETFASRSEVTAIGLYVESISSPHDFEKAIRTARKLNKPVVALKSGNSAVAQKMAMSHTASLSGSDDLINELFERAGVGRAYSLEALIETLKILHQCGPLSGSEIGLSSTSGGDLSLVADVMEKVGVQFKALSNDSIHDLQSVMHERVNIDNPLDYQMFNWDSLEDMKQMHQAFMSNDFDLSISILDYPRHDRCDQTSWTVAEQAMVLATGATKRTAAVLSTLADNMPEQVANRIMDAGLIPLIGIQSGIEAVSIAATIGRLWAEEATPSLQRLHKLSDQDSGRVLNEVESKEMLAEFNISIPAGREVNSSESALQTANEIGYPVVAKAVGIAHKSDVGGVFVNIASDSELLEAVSKLKQLSETVLIEQMVQGVVAELIVGVSRDEQFGPYLVVGAGGVQVELTKDSRPLLIPSSKSQILNVLNSLKCSPLFHGFRGQAQADLDAAVSAIEQVQSLVIEHANKIQELDINPLFLLKEGQGVVAGDALIRLT